MNNSNFVGPGQRVNVRVPGTYQGEVVTHIETSGIVLGPADSRSWLVLPDDQARVSRIHGKWITPVPGEPLADMAEWVPRLATELARLQDILGQVRAALWFADTVGPCRRRRCAASKSAARARDLAEEAGQ